MLLPRFLSGQGPGCRRCRWWRYPRSGAGTARAHQRHRSAAGQAEQRRGQTHLRREGQGYLKSLLAALGISQDSQVLPFTRSSLQFDKISPTRAARHLFQRRRGGGIECSAARSWNCWPMTRKMAGWLFIPSMPTAARRSRAFAREEGRCRFRHAMTGRSSMGWMVADIAARQWRAAFHQSQPAFQFHRPSHPVRGGAGAAGMSPALMDRWSIAAM